MSPQLRQRKCFECSSEDSRSHWFWFRLFFNVLLVIMEAPKAEEMHLRHVETDVLIPKMMREKAKELCVINVEAFNHCCKDNGFFMVFKCREENAALKECITTYYRDPAFFEECKQEYIQEKLEFLRTGVPTKNRKQKLPTSM